MGASVSAWGKSWGAAWGASFGLLFYPPIHPSPRGEPQVFECRQSNEQLESRIENIQTIKRTNVSASRQNNTQKTNRNTT